VPSTNEQIFGADGIAIPSITFDIATSNNIHCAATAVTICSDLIGTPHPSFNPTAVYTATTFIFSLNPGLETTLTTYTLFI
jgi:hypothetical protein